MGATVRIRQLVPTVSAPGEPAYEGGHELWLPAPPCQPRWAPAIAVGLAGAEADGLGAGDRAAKVDWPVVSRPGQPVGFDMRPSRMGSQHGQLPDLSSAARPSRHHPLIRAPWALTLVRVA